MGREIGRVLRKVVWLVPIAAVAAFARPVVAAGGEKTSSGAPVCKDAGVKVTFVKGSMELDTNGQGALAGVAVWLQNGDQRTVRLEGFTDRSGGATGNQRLSERRAQAAKDYLLGRGIEPERIMVFGHGEQDDQRLTGAAARIVRVTACDAAPEPAAETPPPAAEPEPAPTPAPAPEPPTPAPVPKAAPLPRAVPPPNLAPPRADAAPARPAPPPLAPPPLAPPPPAAPNVPLTGLGVEATIGGGAIGFIDQSARDMTSTGASWNARIMFGSRLPLAVETAYTGSVQSIDALGLSTNAFLLGNGVEGTLRVNLIRARVQPYLFGGVGWTHYQITNVNNTATSSVLGRDDVGTLPMGAGVTTRVVGAFLIDVRAIYRATFNDDMLRAAAISANSMQSWNVAAQVGFEF